MDELLKDLERTGHLTSSLSFFDVTTALCLSFALSLVIAWIYRATHQGVSYSQQYVHTLVLMGTVVALIMLIIGSNVARAFALVGALSIIRFRNAVKETRDVGFIFLVMALGMAVGTRFYPGDLRHRHAVGIPGGADALQHVCQGRHGTHPARSVSGRSGLRAGV